MTQPVRLRKEAERDLVMAASWYEEQRAGLGYEFLDRALSALQTIAEHPTMYPLVHRNMRRALISRFPFGIYFLVEQPHIVVVAVMHGSRHPRRWQRRS
jgi:plasmid stabilization system protein ParE